MLYGTCLLFFYWVARTFCLAKRGGNISFGFLLPAARRRSQHIILSVFGMPTKWCILSVLLSRDKRYQKRSHRGEGVAHSGEVFFKVANFDSNNCIYFFLRSCQNLVIQQTRFLPPSLREPSLLPWVASPSDWLWCEVGELAKVSA